MPDDLDKVNWAWFFREEPHPPDIPQLLQDLTSLDSNLREGVEYGLGELFGTCPDVIPRLVPFLLELARTTVGGVKASVLGLLLTIAGGLEPPEPDCDCVYSVEGRPELAKEIRTAIGQGRHLYRDSLRDADPEVRELASCIVGVTQDLSALDVLRDQFGRESHPRAYVRMLGALSRLAPQEALSIAERDLTSPDPLVKLHAAAIAAELTKPAILRQALDALVELAMEWWEIDWARYNAIISVSRLGDDALSYALDHWIERLADPPGRLADLVGFLLRGVFRSRAPFPTPVSPSEIKPNQLKVLHALATTPAAWQHGHLTAPDVHDDFEASGLPSTQEKLIELLRQAKEHNTP